MYIKNCINDFNDRLKLNKLLFYTDFYCYNLTGNSITGISYRAIQYGPAPANYDNIYDIIEEEGYITQKWVKVEKGSGREIFESKRSLDKNVFTEDEINVINLIIDNFKDIPTWDLVDLSHKEAGWKENEKSRNIIIYQKYAFKLKALA